MPSDSALLSELNDAYSNDSQEWGEIYKEGQTDAQIIAGDPWGALDPGGKAQRIAAERPMLAPDEIGQYLNQVINGWRENPRGVVFSPRGGRSSKDGAKFYQNKWREIEYRSNAIAAYITAGQNMVERGYGYVRVNARYSQDALIDTNVPPTAQLFEKELSVEPFPNPDMVLPDPYNTGPNLAQMKRCFVLEWFPVRDFKRDYPDAEIQNFTPAITAKARAFFTKDNKQVLVAEAWKREQISTRKLLMIKAMGQRSRLNPTGQPMPVWADTLESKPASRFIHEERDVPVMQVRQYLTNGVEILKRVDWPGKYIPITGCFGKTIYVDKGSGSEKLILSLTRLARDPFMALCYIWSCQAEIVGGTPKFPYFFYEGSLSVDALELLAQSVDEPVAGIPVKPTIPGVQMPGGVAIPFPQRNPYTGEALQYLELVKESARRAIQASMGISPLPTQAQRQNEKSGEALRQIESNSQRGSFHFNDGFDGMVAQVGVIGEDLMDKAYDTARVVAVREPGGKDAVIEINNPENPKSISTEGDYGVTVSAGPSTQSQQKVADDLMDSMTGNLEAIATLAGPGAAKKILAGSIRNKVKGPAGDELADIIDPQDQEQMGPAQAQAAMQENQQLKGALTELQKVVQGDLVKTQAAYKTELLKAKAESLLKIELKRMDMEIAAMGNAAKIEAATIAADKGRAEITAQFEREILKLALGNAHDESQMMRTQAHELGLKDVDVALTPSPAPDGMGAV